MTAKILAADIGGTSSRFAAFEVGPDGHPQRINSTWLKTGEAKTFAELLDQLRASGFVLPPEKADISVFAIAGPIDDGVYVKPPLISWDVDMRNAERDFNIKKFALINDFIAQAFTCRSPIGRAAEQIIDGTIDETAAVAAIGAGTGLGKAILLPDGHGGYVGGASEGGHTNYAAETDREFEFQLFMTKQTGADYLTWNEVVSGAGLSRVHAFLTGEQLTPSEVAKQFDTARETLEWATRFYARVCRNYALETLCFGGMYIAGGVAAKNPVLVKSELFHSEFHRSRVHRKVLEQIPVFLIDNEESGLWGAAVYGAQKLRAK